MREMDSKFCGKQSLLLLNSKKYLGILVMFLEAQPLNTLRCLSASLPVCLPVLQVSYMKTTLRLFYGLLLYWLVQQQQVIIIILKKVEQAIASLFNQPGSFVWMLMAFASLNLLDSVLLLLIIRDYTFICSNLLRYSAF